MIKYQIGVCPGEGSPRRSGVKKALNPHFAIDPLGKDSHSGKEQPLHLRADISKNNSFIQMFSWTTQGEEMQGAGQVQNSVSAFLPTACLSLELGIPDILINNCNDYINNNDT